MLQPNAQNPTLWCQINELIQINKMGKILTVIDPFFVMEVGDTFEWSADDNMYIANHSEEFHKTDDSDSEIRSTYQSNFAISADYAKELIADGYLEDTPNEPKKVFTNVFDEINRLIDKYEDEKDNLAEDMANMPECLKVERATVLNNILSVLDHLKELKK